MKATYYSAGYLGKQDRYDVPRKFAFVCAVACANCGHFLSVKWETDHDNDSIPTAAKQKISVCPVCGKKTPLKKELSAVSKATTNTAAVQILEKKIDSNVEAASRKSVSTLIAKVSTEKELPSDNIQAQRVNAEVSALKQYIANLLSAESAVYFLTERIINLHKAQMQNNQNIAAQNAKTAQEWEANAKKTTAAAERKRKDDIKAAKDEVSALKKKITALKKEITNLKKDFSEKDWSTEVKRKDIPRPRKQTILPIVIPPMPTAPVLKQPGLFNKKKVAEENAVLTAQYNAMVAAYNEACVKAEQAKKENQRREQQYQAELVSYYAQMDAESARMQQEAQSLKEQARVDVEAKIQSLKKEIEALTQQVSQKETNMEADAEDTPVVTMPMLPEENAISIFLDREVREAEKQIKHAVKVRAQLYAYGIIHPKYRNQVALSTIYEYLDTGRCDGLVGASGAYNLFESECRSNLIISQLTQVIETLEEIKKTQYLIYAELKQINANLDRLNQKMDQVFLELSSLRDEVGDMNRHLTEIAGNTESLVDSSQQISEHTAMIRTNTSAIMTNTNSIAEDTKKIQNNTVISAYYSAVNAHYAKINAQLTNAVGFMLALK